MALNEADTSRHSGEVRSIEALASVLDIGIMIYDRNDILITATPQFLRFFDISPELLKPGARLRDLFAATFDTGARALGSVDGQTRNISREDWIAERTALHWRERYESVERIPDGRWVRLCKRRLPDGTLISTIQDISEQKGKDAELAEIRRNAELLQSIVDGLPDAVIVKDSELRYVVVNDAFCRIPGLRRKQILGKRAVDLVGPELADRVEKHEREVLETGTPYKCAEMLPRADGTAVQITTHIRRFGTPDDYYIAVSLDNINDLVTDDVVAANGHGTDATAAIETERPGNATSHSRRRGRILVIDEDCERSAARGDALKKAGFDTVSIASPDEVIAFLDAAKSANLAIGEIEITSNLARVLSGNVKSGRHEALVCAIKERIARDAPVDSPRMTVSGQAEAVRVPALPAAAPAAAEIVKGAADPAGARISVLVAEDNDVNQFVVEQILEGIGVDFRIVANGQEAVAAWHEATPDLILMDVSMPVMNGLQAAQAIRQAEATMADKGCHVPIIALTAHAMTGDRERFLAAGMDDYLPKPVSPGMLEAIVQKWSGGAERLLSTG